MGNESEAGVVAQAVAGNGHDPGNLLQVLIEVQSRLGGVPASAMEAVARAMDVPYGHVAAVVTFYSFLSDRPRGTYDIRFSDSITDHMLGSRERMAYLCETLGVTLGQTRGDNRVTVDVTSCTGLCDQGPAALVNGHAITNLDERRLDAVARAVEAGLPLDAWPPELFRVRDNIRRGEILLETPLDPGEALKAALGMTPEGILERIDQSGLRGRGGAGFKTATKWRCCAGAEDQERIVVCNADEGEPGTFKDRVLLQSHADRVFEGMTLCARATGARTGYLYLRGEYRYLKDDLHEVLARRREAGLLGERILGHPGFGFDIHIHLGAGAYICGEESALIESLEGKRGVPRKRPPFPVTCGCFQRPTVVNNVETFVAAADILAHGVDWFRSRGTERSTGTKLLSVCGDCERPGIYEYPFGVSIGQVLKDCGADNPQAVQAAGPAGHLVSPAGYDRTIGFEDVSTGGAFMVFGQDRDLLDVLVNFTRFFAHESCGFCTPCRVGTSLMRDLMAKVQAGHGTGLDLEEMRRVGELMRHTSHCGLGTTAPNAVLDALESFSQILQARLTDSPFEPAFDLDAALSEARQLTGRDDPGVHLG